MATPEDIEQQFEETALALREVLTADENTTVTLPGGGTVRSMAKIDKDAADALAATIANFGDEKVDKTSIGASGGIMGFSGYKAILKNAAGTVASFLASAATAQRTWTIPDKDGTFAFLSDITAKMGIANGLATLDANGLVPSTQLPSYVDDILEFDTKALLTAATVAQGAQTKGKIYLVDADESDSGATNQYRWSGSAYVKLVPSPGTTDSVVEGATNKYFTTARVLATALTGLSGASTAVLAATDTIIVALGKLQAQIRAIPYDVMTFVGSKPAASGKVLFVKAGRAFTIPANFAGAQVEALTAATAATVWTLTRNGTAIGTFSWAAAGTIPTMATTGGAAINIAVGDKLILTAAATQDAALADTAVHILATLT